MYMVFRAWTRSREVMDEKCRLIVESLTIPVSLVAEPDRNA